MKLSRIPFSWSRIHGPLWWVISQVPLEKAPLSLWVACLTGFTSFFFIGTTRNARLFYLSCMVKFCNYTPLIFIPPIRKFWRELNDRQLAIKSKEYIDISEGYAFPTIPTKNRARPTRGRVVKHWFDSDNEHDQDVDGYDTRSMPSSELTLTGKEDPEHGMQLSVHVSHVTTHMTVPGEPAKASSGV